MVAHPSSTTTAAAAAQRVSRATLTIGALGLVTALFILDRLAATWHVGAGVHAGAGASEHTITLIGVRLRYPAANVSAIAVLLLATIGLAMTLRALAAASREGVRSRRLVRSLAEAARPHLEDGVHVIDDPHPDALVAGLINPRVYITTGALSLLDRDAAAAVLAHERHHAARRDPLRRAAGRVLVDALFFVPSLKRLVLHELQLSELGADESACAAGRPALARALLAMEPHGGIDPSRVDQLLGDTGRSEWLFPASLCVVAIGALVLLGLTTAVLAHAASGTATLAPPLLSRQPCILTLAALPAVIAAILARCSRAFAPAPNGSLRTRARRSSRSY